MSQTGRNLTNADPVNENDEEEEEDDYGEGGVGTQLKFSEKVFLALFCNLSRFKLKSNQIVCGTLIE